MSPLLEIKSYSCSSSLTASRLRSHYGHNKMNMFVDTCLEEFVVVFAFVLLHQIKDG